ncbi:MAG: sigma-54 dependent transcriptional regulator [Deltaproteobacteria bacterium]|jgi:two-component system NtrC family response regulator
MAKVLIIDDNTPFCDMLQRVAQRMGHHVTSARLLRKGLRVARSESFEVVFLSARMPDGHGLDVLPKILETPSSPEVIVISDSGDPDEAEAAIKRGAWDYVERPFSEKAIALPLFRALQYQARKIPTKPSVSLKQETFEGIIGNSPVIRACLEVVAQAADSDASVLITGETGTGKELFAWAIHNNSARAEKNFVIVDCAALPETLVESTLFGHERGAYTGAEKARDGLILQANGGTLFLDEVGELPFPLQKTFLRVLEEHRFRPVGRKQEIESDFRLISASNRDLDDMVRRKLFRKDLLFRIRSLTIELPPLRERNEDIEDLVEHHVAQLYEEYGIAKKEFSPEFLPALASYEWPGNVRELVKALESAIVSARHEPMIFPKHLPTEIRAKMARTSVGDEKVGIRKRQRSTDRKETLPGLQALREAAVAEVEKNYLQELMSLTGGKVKDACRISGLSRSRLYELLKKHHVSTSG